jgi:hypothetical protein
MIKNHSRSTILMAAALFGAGALTYGSRAEAAPPTKDECVEAHGRGQDAREKGQLADSKRLFLVCAQSSCPALLQSDCAKFGDELARTVPSVSFAARDARGADLLDTQVFVDGALVQSRLDEGKSYDLDPGKHTVRFVHAGKDVIQGIVVSSGEKGRAIVATFGDSSAAGVTNKATTNAEPSKPSRSAVPLVVAALGGAAMIAGSVLLVSGLGDVPDNCSRSAHNCAASPGDPSFDDAKSAVSRANLGLGIGIGGAADATLGLIWYLASSPSEPEKASSSASAITPWTDGRGGGASWHLAF